MKNLFIASAWMLLTVGLVLTGVSALSTWHLAQTPQAKAEEPSAAEATPEKVILPVGQVKGISTSLESEDARPIIVANFLERHNSPLIPHEHYGRIFVDIADRYGVDFRLLPAIAMQESNLCKRIPPGSHNCLGFGIHERGTLGFESYEANFDRAARELKKYYIDQGRTTPEEIMRKYTPSSNGSWAASVNQWMAEMRYDDRALGRSMDINGSVLEFVPENRSN